MNYKKLVPILGLLTLIGLGFFAFLRAGVEELREESGPEVPGEAPFKSFQGVEFEGTRAHEGLEDSGDLEPGPVYEAIPTREVWAEMEVPQFIAPELNEAPPLDVSRETWSDPVNQRVLGEKRWMAEPNDVESERIEAVLNTPMPPTRQGVQARANNITEMKARIEHCSEQFPTGGRLVVIWELLGDGVLATPRDIRLGPVVDVTDERLLDCITRFQLTSHPTAENFRMTVEYPVFLEDL